MSPFDQVKKKEVQEQKRWADIRKFAAEQGYVLVQMSPRRYIVVHNTSTGGMFAITGFEGYYTYQTGTVVFGPGTWDRCRAFIAENGKPLPPELQGA